MAGVACLLAVLLCGVLSHAAGQVTPPEAGKPVVVNPTPGFNPDPDGAYSTINRDPNPTTDVEWVIAYPPPAESVIAIGQALIPGSQDAYLFVGRHAAEQKDAVPGKEYLAALLELEAPGGPRLSNVTAASDMFCSIPVQTSEGKILVVSGSEANANGFKDGLKNLRVYDYQNDPTDIKEVALMECGRWYPTATLMPDQTHMIQGGTQRASEFGPNCEWLERWNESKADFTPPLKYPVDPEYLKIVKKNFYPATFVLPTGDLYIQNNDQIRFLRSNGSYRAVPNIPPFPPNVATEWPRSSAIVMSPLTYEDNFSSADIIVFGGTPADAPCTYGPPGNQVLADRKVYRLTIAWKINPNGPPVYSFPKGAWEVEDMGIPRVGGDATFLPNGDLFVTSGSQRGCHGASKDGQGRNSFPSLWPILYLTDQPKGKRVTVVEATTIARVYHMSATLTLDGLVQVAGCDVCRPTKNFKELIDPVVRDSWWSPSVTGRREFRTEHFYSPYALDVNNRPKILSLNRNKVNTSVINTSYGDTVSVTWESDVPNDKHPLVPITGATLIAPSAATHGYNTNQRVIFVKIINYNAPKGAKTGSLTLVMPPNTRVAPPQQYLLFLLNQKTHSRARWVNLQLSDDTSGAVAKRAQGTR